MFALFVALEYLESGRDAGSFVKKPRGLREGYSFISEITEASRRDAAASFY